MFTTPLILQPVNGRHWQVRAELVFESPSVGRLIVPAGFITDLNSIPRLYWSVSPPTDFPEAGTLHDWLYSVQFGRAEADQVYAEALASLGMDTLRVKARYVALRLFGGLAYRNHAKGGSLEHL